MTSTDKKCYMSKLVQFLHLYESEFKIIFKLVNLRVEIKIDAKLAIISVYQDALPLSADLQGESQRESMRTLLRVTFSSFRARVALWPLSWQAFTQKWRRSLVRVGLGRRWWRVTNSDSASLAEIVPFFHPLCMHLLWLPSWF